MSYIRTNRSGPVSYSTEDPVEPGDPAQCSKTAASEPPVLALINGQLVAQLLKDPALAENGMIPEGRELLIVQTKYLDKSPFALRQEDVALMHSLPGRLVLLSDLRMQARNRNQRTAFLYVQGMNETANEIWIPISHDCEPAARTENTSQQFPTITL